jgi:hypothetical protein
MTTRFLSPAALAIAALLTIGSFPRSAAVAAGAEEARIYGVTQGPMSSRAGTFTPAKSNLYCYSVQDNRCWDGSAWHEIFPRGPRHYATPTTNTVSCVAIMKESHDCWDGSNWYRLPPGQLQGVLAGPLAHDAGVFMTAPLR